MVGVETRPLIGLDKLQPSFIVIVQWQIVAIQMIEYTEFHTIAPKGEDVQRIYRGATIFTRRRAAKLGLATHHTASFGLMSRAYRRIHVVGRGMSFAQIAHVIWSRAYDERCRKVKEFRDAIVEELLCGR
jgi:hypothetical protein